MGIDETARRFYVLASADTSNCNSSTSSLWTYNVATTTWTQLAPPSGMPPGKLGIAATYDQAAKKMYVFGGRSRVNNCSVEIRWNDLWVYDVATNAWTQLSPTGGPPTARGGHTAVYDQTAKKMYIFGGFSGPSWLGDLWVYDVAANTWTQLAGASETRYNSSAAYDQTAKKMYVFGGTNNSQYSQNQLWVYNVATNAWTTLSPTGTLPGVRRGHSAIFDQTSTQMYVFGGGDYSPPPSAYGTNVFFNDLWTFLAAPYAASGTFTSKIFDTGGNVGFGALTWMSTE
jgi:N-acetylneuraminic acid mutarotase